MIFVGHVIVDEAEIENDIETETVARTKKKNANENARDCLRLKKNI